MLELDPLDNKAAAVLEGYLVRKDLVRTFSRQFPVPTYVVEFMLGRYCASTVPEEIDEGLEIVQRQLRSRTVRAGEEELFKARARENGEVKIIDLITARLDNRGEYVASLPSLRLTDVRISGELVNQHERMLTGGFYAELTVSFDMAIAQESKGRSFGVESLRPIQLSRRDALDTLRNQSRISPLQNRVYFGGALSGRDTNAVNKTVSGLLKLLYPSGDEAVPEADLEWAVRIAMEVRRRVKEQQKRIGAAEFRNTHFSYIMGADGVEKFVSTPELQSDQSIGGDPLEPGQVWTISPGNGDEHPGLYRIEVNEGPGSGVRILNKPIPPAFRESMGYAEQNLYARAAQLVGDKDPRQHEFTVQLRAFDASRSGARLGIAALVALCTALLRRSVRGGLILVGEINLGGSIEPIHNAVTLAEIAVEKGATALVMPVACRRQLLDLSDDMATRIDIQFYADAKDALLKAMAE